MFLYNAVKYDLFWSLHLDFVEAPDRKKFIIYFSCIIRISNFWVKKFGKILRLIHK